MQRTMSRLAALGLVAVMVGATAHAHFGLAKSLPAADSSVTSPEQLELWFTQAPQDGSVTIRLIDAGGDLMETGDPMRSADDAKMMSVTVDNALAPGVYTVAWRGIGDDGHVIRDDFTFSVTAER